MGPDRFETCRELAGGRRSGRGGCGWSRLAGALPLEPSPDPRVLEEPQEFAHGGRRRARVRLDLRGRSRRLRHGSGRRRPD